MADYAEPAVDTLTRLHQHLTAIWDFTQEERVALAITCLRLLRVSVDDLRFSNSALRA